MNAMTSKQKLDFTKPTKHLTDIPADARRTLGNAVRQTRQGYQTFQRLMDEHLVANRYYGTVIDADVIEEVLQAYATGGDVALIAANLQVQEEYVTGIFEALGFTREELKVKKLAEQADASRI